MGRPIKSGLDYFPLDTEWDIKMQLVKARFGLVGIGCIIELYKMIYHEGYFIKWDTDTRILFTADNRIDEKLLDEILNFSVSKEVFHAGKLNNQGILTSRGIQKRWLRIAKESNRAKKEIDPAIDLLSEKENPIPEYPFPILGINAKNALSVPESTQSIGKDIISKETKEEEERKPSVFDQSRHDASKRIETARALWNEIKPGPPCRLLSIQFRPEDTSECLRTMSAYTDEDIAEAMRNYASILQSSEHEIKSRYQSFVGFIRGGVEKFVSVANPWAAYRKQGQGIIHDRSTFLDMAEG